MLLEGEKKRRTSRKEGQGTRLEASGIEKLDLTVCG